MTSTAPLSFRSRAFKDAAWFHLAFFTVAIPLALTLRGAALGWTLLGLAALYNVLLPVIGIWRGHRQWFPLWAFLMPLSAALPMADWMLVERMGTLEFPDHGVPRIGGLVPIYFVGLWIMLLWPLCWSAQLARFPYLQTGVLAAVAFIAWEWAARPLGLWHAIGVKSLAGFALYPIVPEILLSMAALWMWRQLDSSPRPAQIAGALAVAIFYAGALALALLWIG